MENYAVQKWQEEKKMSCELYIVVSLRYFQRVASSGIPNNLSILS